MLNTIKSTYTVPLPRTEVKVLVEEFARQDKQRLFPFELQNFRLGVRFQNAGWNRGRGLGMLRRQAEES